MLVYRLPKYAGIIPTMVIVDPDIPPEPPTYSIPMTVTLPLVGEMATSTAAIIGAAVVVILLLLVGFLLGRIGHGGYDDDDYDDDGGDDRPPQPPRPRNEAAHTERTAHTEQASHAVPHHVRTEPSAPVQQPKTAPRQSAPLPRQRTQQPAAPAPGKVSDDTLTSPFVEDLSGQMQQELAARQAEAAARQAAEKAAQQAAEPPAASAEAPKVPMDTMSLDELLKDIHNM